MMRRCILPTALALVLVLAAAASARPGRAAHFTYWRVASASGKVVVNLSGTDPDLVQVDASITATWRTTRSVDQLTFPFPTRPVGRLKDTETFGDLEKVKGTVVSASAKGTTLGTDPQPFSCSKSAVAAPAEFFNQPGEIPVTGGSLGGAKLGIGVQHVDPYAVFTCPGPHNLPVSTIVSSERIDWTQATFKPIGGGALQTGKKGKRVTLTIRETAPVVGGAGTIGTAVSSATLHLVFTGAA
jgi:hypothetical protein